MAFGGDRLRQCAEGFAGDDANADLGLDRDHRGYAPLSTRGYRIDADSHGKISFAAWVAFGSWDIRWVGLSQQYRHTVDNDMGDHVHP